MKKLEKLKLHSFEEICADEQKSIKGGGEWRTEADGNTYWYVGEIEIGAFQEPPGGWAANCPRCQQNKEYGIVSDPIYSTENQRFWINTVTEFFANTLPHILGSGGHINGNETYYKITLADGTIITGKGGN